MSTGLYVPLLVFLALTRTHSVANLPEFEIPEIDGSAVDDTCRIFSSPTPDSAPAAIPTTSTTKVTTPTPVTKKVIRLNSFVVTTKIQPLPKKPAPIRPQPAAAQPITNSHSNSAARLLQHLLTNSRGRTGARFNGLVSQPIRGPHNGGWSVGSSSEEDSSDES